MKRIQWINLLFITTMGIVGCSTEERTEDPSFDKEISVELKNKSELPEWLADYISYLEYVPEGQPLQDSPYQQTSGIYRFKLNGKTFYEFHFSNQDNQIDDLTTIEGYGMFSNIYTAEGIPAILKKENYLQFSEDVQDWTIVYLFRQTHERPANHIYPAKEQEQNQKVSKFFDKESPSFVYGDSDILMIEDESQLRAAYPGTEMPPTIDFSKYKLILAKTTVNPSSMLRWQEITTEGNKATLHLYFEDRLQSKQGDDSKTCYSWALYPRQDLIHHKVSALTPNFRKEFELTPAWFSDESPTPESLYQSYLDNNLKQVRASDFAKLTKGYAWRETSAYMIADNQLQRMWQGPIGRGFRTYEFGEGTMTLYGYNGNESPISFYNTGSYRYDENTNSLYFIDTEIPELMILAASEESITAISVFNHLVVTMKRLTEDELTEIREKHFINSADIYREMTKEDLYHKWVLMSCYSIQNNYHTGQTISNSRKNDAYSIQFFADGTFKGKNNGDLFKGTYEYDGQGHLSLSPSEKGSLPGYFYTFTTIEEAKIELAAYLYIKILNGDKYQFTRGIDD